MKYSILTLLALFIAGIVHGQENEFRIPEYDMKYMIGTSLTSTYGSGLSYGIINNKHGLTLSVLPLLYSGNDQELDNYLNIGLSYNYYFRQNEHVDFSMKIGGNIERGYNPLLLGFVETDRINLGIGPEINVHLFKEIDIVCNIGYGLYDLVDNLNSRLSGGIGIYYNIYK